MCTQIPGTNVSYIKKRDTFRDGLGPVKVEYMDHDLNKTFLKEFLPDEEQERREVILTQLEAALGKARVAQRYLAEFVAQSFGDVSFIKEHQKRQILLIETLMKEIRALKPYESSQMYLAVKRSL